MVQTDLCSWNLNCEDAYTCFNPLSLSALISASSLASARFSTAASRALTMCEPLSGRLHDGLQTLPALTFTGGTVQAGYGMSQ